LSTAAELHPDLQSYLHDIDRARKMLNDVLQDLTDEHLHQRPALKEWSVSECIDHLIVTAGATAPKFEAAIDKGRRKKLFADGPFKYSRFDIWVVNGAVDYPPRRRFKAPRVFAPPAESPDRHKLVADFERAQARLSGFINAANGLDLKRVKVVSPVSRFIRISLGQYLRMATGHQLRHLHQAADAKRRVLTMTSLK
jgi:hypothetical protein